MGPKGVKQFKSWANKSRFPVGKCLPEVQGTLLACQSSRPSGKQGSRLKAALDSSGANQMTLYWQKWPEPGSLTRQSQAHTTAETHKGHLAFLVSDSSTQNRRDLIQVLGKLRIKKKTEVLTGFFVQGHTVIKLWFPVSLIVCTCLCSWLKSQLRQITHPNHHIINRSSSLKIPGRALTQCRRLVIVLLSLPSPFHSVISQLLAVGWPCVKLLPTESERRGIETWLLPLTLAEPYACHVNEPSLAWMPTPSTKLRFGDSISRIREVQWLAQRHTASFDKSHTQYRKLFLTPL